MRHTTSQHRNNNGINNSMRSWSVPAVLGVRRSGSLNFFATHNNYKHILNSLIYSTLTYMYSHNNYSHNYSSIHTQKNYILNRHPSPCVAVGRARRVACEQ